MDPTAMNTRSTTNLELILRELTAAQAAPKLTRTVDRPSQYVGLHLCCRRCYPREEHVKPIGCAIDQMDGREKVVCVVWRLCLN